MPEGQSATEQPVSKARKTVGRVMRAPGVRTVRRAGEIAVTPNVRVDLARLDDIQTRHSADILQLKEDVADIEANLPAVLNAISSMSGAARLVKRELDSFRDELEGIIQQLRGDVEDVRAQIARGDEWVLGEVRPHIETLSWLMRRVETVRFEMLNELRYGRHPDGHAALEPRIVNPEALERSPLRVNIGAGHIPFDDYVNVDMRELPGIDVVATVDDLPFEPGSVDEIFSSHTLEHFPQEVLRRQLLPYWESLLKPGGIITTIAPDVEAMSADYQRGEMPFEDFREVLYGAQEYEGDAHFTGFTPGSFCDLLREAGFVEPLIVASDRRNGKCKEFEITARKAE